MNPEEFRELLESAVADRDETALGRLETEALQSPQTREIWHEHLALEQALSVWSHQHNESTAVDSNHHTAPPIAPLPAQTLPIKPQPRISLLRGGLLSLGLLLTWGVFAYGPARQQQVSQTLAVKSSQADSPAATPRATPPTPPLEWIQADGATSLEEDSHRSPKNLVAAAPPDSAWSRSLTWWQTDPNAEQTWNSAEKTAVTFLPAWSHGLSLGEKSASLLDEEPRILLPTTLALAESSGPLTPILLLPALPTMTEHLEQRVSATWETLSTLPQDMWQKWQGTWQPDSQAPQIEPIQEQPENWQPQSEEPREPPRRRLRRTRPGRTFSLELPHFNPTYSA